ncbi:MAG: hypothetical protein D6694_05010 [Gammaproteobacteria bacterium]|nr:MAG: hypothetical protein D6694_05010 [Gammaproteobacteria bacterium]
MTLLSQAPFAMEESDPLSPNVWSQWLTLLDQNFDRRQAQEMEARLLRLTESSHFDYLNAVFVGKARLTGGLDLCGHSLALKVYARAASRLASHALAGIARMLAEGLSAFESESGRWVRRRRTIVAISPSDVDQLTEPVRTLLPQLFVLQPDNDGRTYHLIARSIAESERRSGLPAKQLPAMRELVRQTLWQTGTPISFSLSEPAELAELCVAYGAVVEAARWLRDEHSVQRAARMLRQLQEAYALDKACVSPWLGCEWGDALVPLAADIPEMVRTLLPKVAASLTDNLPEFTARCAQIAPRLRALASMLGVPCPKILDSESERPFYWVQIDGNPLSISRWRLALSFEYQPGCWIDFRVSKNVPNARATVYGHPERGQKVFEDEALLRRWLLSAIAAAPLGQS